VVLGVNLDCPLLDGLGLLLVVKTQFVENRVKRERGEIRILTVQAGRGVAACVVMPGPMSAAQPRAYLNTLPSGAKGALAYFCALHGCAFWACLTYSDSWLSTQVGCPA
jgi:hypothetical protein